MTAGVITADQLAEAEAIAVEPEQTSEQAYMAALDDEVAWELTADGRLVRVDDHDLASGPRSAWTPRKRVRAASIAPVVA